MAGSLSVGNPKFGDFVLGQFKRGLCYGVSVICIHPSVHPHHLLHTSIDIFNTLLIHSRPPPPLINPATPTSSTSIHPSTPPLPPSPHPSINLSIPLASSSPSIHPPPSRLPAPFPFSFNPLSKFESLICLDEAQLGSVAEHKVKCRDGAP